jgi:peroxiredoxin
MKKLILILAAACLLMGCLNEKTFTVSGTLTDFGNPDGTTMIYLKTKNMAEDWVLLDSTYLKDNGAFALKGKSSETDLFYLTDKDNIFFLRLFVDPGNKIKVTGSATDIQNLMIKGSKAQDMYDHYLALFAPIIEAQQNIEQQFYNYQLDETISDEDFELIEMELGAAYQRLEEEGKNITHNFICDNSNHIVAAFLVYQNIRYVSTSAEIEEQLQWLDPAMNNKFTALLKEQVEKVKQTEVGATLPNIELPDADGNLISTASLRGKYLLIDFWASWCGPCVGEIPNLKKAYAAYHEKGFEIISISLDSERDAWLNSVAKHELNWLHVSDLLAFRSPVVKQLAVNYVPHTFLLDPQGVVIAVDVREDALENKLKEVMQ